MIRLAKPEIPSGALERIGEIIRSGMLVQGRFVAEFERKLSEYLQIPHVAAVSNGSSALLLAMAALGLKRGDSVIVPDFTFPAAANAAMNLGCDAIPVDVEEETFCIAPESLKRSIRKDTKAIVAVHQFGIPCRIDIVREIASKNRLFLIEDAACSIGGRHSGIKSGCYGDVAIFSFHPRKIITTGEGGAAATRDIELHEKIAALRNHGKDSGDSIAPFRAPGFNMRMGEINAALGLAQIDRLDDMIRMRKEVFEIYCKMIDGVRGVKIPAGYLIEGCAYQSLVVVLDRDVDRGLVMDF
ncbi:MAG: DegT/DnrJ/EryC1/StrS family aminotransferase, partial [Deltaproteobacteria bacterium]|nr:DegT/DnrJ/EryC1/StrS family aminotransferase [Deltaproteobacteria bacterium]